MKRSVGTIRMALAGMALVGWALAIFGDMKPAVVDHVLTRIPGEESPMAARQAQDGTVVGAAAGLTPAVLGRSQDSDPCVTMAPISVSARGATVC